MKIEKNKIMLEDGLTKEWIITNGIGGYASSTILGCNTRKYHGLLIAPFTPPARRYLILSKIDESIVIDNNEYILYTNMCTNYISDGYKYLESFEKDYVPIFTYNIDDITVKKIVCMEHGKNTVCILYKVITKDKPCKLNLAPIINFRDFHQMYKEPEFNLKQIINNRKVKIIVNDNSETPIYMNFSKGNYTKHDNDTFRNMYYIEEEKRGFDPEENHAVTGVYEVEIGKNEEKEFTFVCSLEDNIDEIDARNVINKEIIRINELMIDSGMIEIKKQQTHSQIELIKDFIVATDNFVVYRPSFGLHTLIAGYHWFLDWGRDALISFEGLLLKTKRYNIAKEVLLTFTRDIKFGLVPNGYSGFDNRPLYNSADASLLLFEQVYKYIKYTNNIKFIKEKIYPRLKEIIISYQNGIDLDDNNIYLDDDNLLVAGTENTQNTWMDAKCGTVAITPRNGKAVELNSLWYNALRIMEELSKQFEGKKEAKVYEEMANKTRESFYLKFYNKKRKCLYDVLGDGKIRPNQLFALSLSHPILNPASEEADNIMNVVTKKLLNKYGLKSLAKGEENYVEVYEGEPLKRDMSYHQGITWPWLLGLYYDALKNQISAQKDKDVKKKLQEQLKEFRESVTKTYLDEFYNKGVIGSISEIYDSKAPFLPKGAIAQGWSVAEVFRIILENK